MSEELRKDKCRKCRYEWLRRSILPPRQCPKCKSYYWKTPPTGKKPKEVKK